ncbi:hypothetical protein PVK06_042575 [Gossypium arboreum]|uniref:Uncharacterized protein n=1 Tax=Gossypium arboreum TaxID=29729 RepID=A0ABR0ML53_GOSAR|nr:hypothetical protein PVK06_042575 [Gossypium arboreum]
MLEIHRTFSNFKATEGNPRDSGTKTICLPLPSSSPIQAHHYPIHRKPVFSGLPMQEYGLLG